MSAQVLPPYRYLSARTKHLEIRSQSARKPNVQKWSDWGLNPGPFRTCKVIMQTKRATAALSPPLSSYLLATQSDDLWQISHIFRIFVIYL